ncbi:MAG: hypothetical protein R3Y63_04930 [Eubacteriales bacterium]
MATAKREHPGVPNKNTHVTQAQLTSASTARADLAIKMALNNHNRGKAKS